MNRLARNLSIPLNIEDAATSLSTACVDQIDVVEVNGRLFLCNSMMGLPLRVAEQRQELRGAQLINRIVGYTGLLGRVLTSTHRIEIELDDGGNIINIKANALAVSNNAFDEKPSLILQKTDLTTGKLAVYVSKHISARERLMVLARALVGQWRYDPKVEEFHAKDIILRSKRKKIRVTNDGEIEELTTPLHYRILPRALNVLRPVEV